MRSRSRAALVERLRTQLDSQRQQASTAEAWLALDGDLHHAAQAAARLGQEVRHVADWRPSRPPEPAAFCAGRPGQPCLGRPAASRHGRSRTGQPARQARCGSLLLADLGAKEAAVRALAETCRAKIADAPPLAVPSIAAIAAARRSPRPSVAGSEGTGADMAAAVDEPARARRGRPAASRRRSARATSWAAAGVPRQGRERRARRARGARSATRRPVTHSGRPHAIAVAQSPSR